MVAPSPQEATQKPNRIWYYSLIWWALVCHSSLCAALSLCMIFLINGYLALDAITPRPPLQEFRFRASDITTLISGALTLVRAVGETWAAATVWRCGITLLEIMGSNANSPRLKHLMSWPRLLLWVPNGRVEWSVALTLLLIFPHAYFSALLTGAVDWESTPGHRGNITVEYLPRPKTSFYHIHRVWWEQYGENYVNQAWGLPEGLSLEMVDWNIYTSPILGGLIDPIAHRVEAFNEALRQATLLWTAGEHKGRQKTACRYVMEKPESILGVMPLHSILYQATLPCVRIHDITWKQTGIEDEFPRPNFFDERGAMEPIAVSNVASLHGLTPPVIGNAILVDRTQTWTVRNESDILQYPPAKVIDTTKALVALVSQSNPSHPTCPKARSSQTFPIFGNITQDLYLEHRGAYPLLCWGNARVDLTVGVMEFGESTFIRDNVIEGTLSDTIPLQADKWTADALQLLPSVMMGVAAQNFSSIPTWNYLDGYMEKLIQISYLASWTAIRRTMEDPLPPAHATLAESRLRAKVSIERVLSWWAVSLCMQLSGLVWYLGVQRAGGCRRMVELDPQMTSLLASKSRRQDNVGPKEVSPTIVQTS